MVNIDILQYTVTALGYIITFALSGRIVHHYIGYGPKVSTKTEQESRVAQNDYDIGTIIGKCENFLTITLILTNAFTGLAVIFAAKSIVRSEDIKKDSKYYLGGTLINFSYSVFMGFFIKILLFAIGHPI